MDPVEAYAIDSSDAAGRPFVRLNMISSLDGAIAIKGRSGSLGGPADQRLFHILRSLADVILVGAGTARAEGYGPVRVSDDLRRRREGRGQSPVPPIAVVTRSASLDWASPLFAAAEAQPIVITSEECDEGARRRAAQRAEVIVAGAQEVDLGEALAQLHAAGYRSVLCEGGPRLNADLARARLLDELCLTLSPRIVAGDGPRLLAGPELPDAMEMETVRLMEEDGFFFLRLRQRR